MKKPLMEKNPHPELVDDITIKQNKKVNTAIADSSYDRT